MNTLNADDLVQARGLVRLWQERWNRTRGEVRARAGRALALLKGLVAEGDAQLAGRRADASRIEAGLTVYRRISQLLASGEEIGLGWRCPRCMEDGVRLVALRRPSGPVCALCDEPLRRTGSDESEVAA